MLTPSKLQSLIGEDEQILEFTIIYRTERDVLMYEYVNSVLSELGMMEVAKHRLIHKVEGTEK